MAIFLKNSWNVPPVRWGSSTDVQYAIRINSEKIYGINSEDALLIQPLFWKLPPIDYSGNNYKSTLFRIFSDFNGYCFNGTNSTIAFGNVLALGDVDWTLSAIVRIDSITNSMAITGKGKNVLGGAADALEYGIQFASGVGFRSLIANQTSLEYVDALVSGVPNVGSSHRIVATHDSVNSKLRIYVDGKYNNVKSLTINQSQSTGGFNIGSWPLASVHARVWDGFIKDVQLHSSVFSDEVISKFTDIPYGLYQKVSRPFYLLPTEPIGWTGEIIGITNPTEILGIATSGISKVNVI